MTNYRVKSNLIQKSSGKRPTFIYMASNIHEGVGTKLWIGLHNKTRDLDVNLICFIMNYVVFNNFLVNACNNNCKNNSINRH